MPMTPQSIKFCSLLLGLVVAATNARGDAPVNASAQIDAIIQLDLKKHKLQPNPPVSDIQFVRRVYLDVIGRIPTDKELGEFFADNRRDRRARLIDKLLESPGHESHMFNWLGDMLRVKDDYYRIGKTWTFHTWLKLQLRENRPWDELVYDMLTAEGRLGENGATAYLLRDASMPLDSLSNTLTTFLGANVACAQCHDHPFAKWTQRDFYEMASFFGSTAFERVDTRKPAITLRDERFSKANLVTLLQPNMERVVFDGVSDGDVRARDVQLLFADASTGAHSPALVRQGQISELINAKPKARRAILEDAAGIGGLYQRRHEAELKLKSPATAPAPPPSPPAPLPTSQSCGAARRRVVCTCDGRASSPSPARATWQRVSGSA